MPLDQREERGVGDVLVHDGGADRGGQPHGHVLEGAAVGVADPGHAVGAGAGRQPQRLRDVGRHGRHLAAHRLEPGLAAQRHHVVDGADHAQPPVVTGRRGGEGAAAGVPVEPAFLHQDVQGLAHGGTADPELRTQRVLGRDPLALALEVATERLGDLEIARDAGPEVHR